jgi:hypothetical protein
MVASTDRKFARRPREVRTAKSIPFCHPAGWRLPQNVERFKEPGVVYRHGRASLSGVGSRGVVPFSPGGQRVHVESGNQSGHLGFADRAAGDEGAGERKQLVKCGVIHRFAHEHVNDDTAYTKLSQRAFTAQRVEYGRQAVCGLAEIIMCIYRDVTRLAASEWFIAIQATERMKIDRHVVVVRAGDELALDAGEIVRVPDAVAATRAIMASRVTSFDGVSFSTA